MRILRTSLIAVSVMAVAGVGIVLANDAAQREPAAFTYSVFDRLQTAADLTAIARYTGDSPQVSLSAARLLGTDEFGNQYLAVRDAVQACLVVIQSADASSGACNALGKDTEVLWLEVGDQNGDRLAIMVPDGYSGDAIRGEQTPLVSEQNLVVLPASMSSVAEVVTIPGSDGRAPLVVNTFGG